MKFNLFMKCCLDEINKFGQLSWCIFYEKIEIRQWISEYLTQVVLMSPNIQMALKQGTQELDRKCTNIKKRTLESGN